MFDYALLCMNAYDPPPLGTYVGVYEVTAHLPKGHGFIAESSTQRIIALRGTHNWSDVLTDFNAAFVGFGSFGSDVLVHGGFLTAAHEVFGFMLMYLSSTAAMPLTITGHSAGGAVATLLAMRLCDHRGGVPDVVTFGCPRVGNKAWQKSVAKIKHTRVVLEKDPIPDLPSSVLGYYQSGQRVHIGFDGEPIGHVRGWWLRLRSYWREITAHSLGRFVHHHLIASYVEALSH